MYSKFQHLMEICGITESQVCNDSGIAPSVLEYWKVGKAFPALQTLKKLSAYFGVTVEYFIADARMIESPVFAERIREVRQETKLSIEEMAALLGINKRAVERWETAKTAPDKSMLIKASRLLNRPIEWLVGDKAVLEDNPSEADMPIAKYESDLGTGVDDLAMQEYHRAAEKFGDVHASPHEAYAVILEELEEAEEELSYFHSLLTGAYWKAVRSNADNSELSGIAIDMYNTALRAAEETIQTAAMAYKAIVTASRDKEQEV